MSDHVEIIKSALTIAFPAICGDSFLSMCVLNARLYRIVTTDREEYEMFRELIGEHFSELVTGSELTDAIMPPYRETRPEVLEFINRLSKLDEYTDVYSLIDAEFKGDFFLPESVAGVEWCNDIEAIINKAPDFFAHACKDDTND